jgi:hypothetical protein
MVIYMGAVRRISRAGPPWQTPFGPVPALTVPAAWPRHDDAQVQRQDALPVGPLPVLLGFAPWRTQPLPLP